MTDKTAISGGIFSANILCPDIAAMAKPGQFAHIKLEGFTLRRPISICGIDRVNGTIRIVFEVRGAGTAKLSHINTGDNLDLLAPLGNGFTLPELAENERAIFVGGGIGVPPLLAAAAVYREQATAILGFRSYDKIILANDFRSIGAEVFTCTDDGSVGMKGQVTVQLKDLLQKGGVGRVFACGPLAMLTTVSQITESFGVPTEVSLEERMGCGVGACAVCACKANKDGKAFMARVCKDGPVFGVKNGEFVALDKEGV